MFLKHVPDYIQLQVIISTVCTFMNHITPSLLEWKIACCFKTFNLYSSLLQLTCLGRLTGVTGISCQLTALVGCGMQSDDHQCLWW